MNGGNIMSNLIARFTLCCLSLLCVVASADAQTVTYIHTDALGSVMAESNANGNVIKRYDYEPYGALVGGQVEDGPGYTGHISDASTGLSYMQQRYMDPQLGVFLSVDPVTAYEQPVRQFNRYRYANSSPYTFHDPDGRLGVDCMGSICDRYRGQGGMACELTCVGGKRSATSGLFVRHKTLKSQEKLIESVGGDTELLRRAHASHSEFVTTLIGFLAGGGFGAGRGTTSLYRAVGPSELADIKAMGAFRNLGSAEGKYFTTSAEGAAAYAKQAVRSFGDQPYTIVRTDVRGSVLNGLTPASVDRGIPAWVVPSERLPGLVPRVMNHSPLPPAGL